MTTTRSDALVLFGITGDLAAKKLFASLYALARDHRLPAVVVGVASTVWTIDQLRSHVHQSLVNGGQVVDEQVFSRLAESLQYVSGDYRESDTYRRLKQALDGFSSPACYLAIPPVLFDVVIEGLAAVDLNRNGRVILEKPFGRDLESAIALNQLLLSHYPEEDIFRIDHFLGKEAVQNLMVFRFANSIFEPIWNRYFIDSVQITMAETFGVEGRGAFYDRVGTLKDVVQNHLLQMVSLLAMEPPSSDAPSSLRDERAKVLQALRPFKPEDMARGQYRGYRDEEGVSPDSDTETFVALRTEIDSWRWAGVPWYIRAGKGMAVTATEAVIEFKRPPRPLFADPGCVPHPNHLRFRMKPDDQITLELQARKPGEALLSHSVPLRVTPTDASPGSHDLSYERLLDDALCGDPRFFARQDGVESAWRIVEPVLTDRPVAEPYDRETWGPLSATTLQPEGGWHDPSA